MWGATPEMRAITSHGKSTKENKKTVERKEQGGNKAQPRKEQGGKQSSAKKGTGRKTKLSQLSEIAGNYIV